MFMVSCLMIILLYFLEAIVCLPGVITPAFVTEPSENYAAGEKEPRAHQKMLICNPKEACLFIKLKRKLGRNILIEIKVQSWWLLILLTKSNVMFMPLFCFINSSLMDKNDFILSLHKLAYLMHFVCRLRTIGAKSGFQAIVVPTRNVYREHFYRGIYITEGMKAYKGDILVRQGQMNYHPGLNVSMKTEHYDKVLRAMCNGKVMITTEDVDPNFELSEVENEYGWKRDVPLKKMTFNVVPDELLGKFRLRETI